MCQKDYWLIYVRERDVSWGINDKKRLYAGVKCWTMWQNVPDNTCQIKRASSGSQLEHQWYINTWRTSSLFQPTKHILLNMPLYLRCQVFLPLTEEHLWFILMFPHVFLEISRSQVSCLKWSKRAGSSCLLNRCTRSHLLLYDHSHREDKRIVSCRITFTTFRTRDKKSQCYSFYINVSMQNDPNLWQTQKQKNAKNKWTTDKGEAFYQRTRVRVKRGDAAQAVWET